MKLEGLTFYYGNSLIFDDFDFSSDKSIIALVGPSGCGKTTLLKIISGYLKPSRINEIKIPKNPLFVIQEDSLMPWLTGEENLNFVNNDNTLHYSDEELFKVISPFIKKRAFEMSYGQRRLIEIYRAILAKPTLMLLDEPFNFLDKLYREIVINSLIKIADDSTKIIFSSHYNEDITDLNAKIFKFNGQFPVKSLIE